MAEFCLECFKRFEPNANENNTTLSKNLEWCEGCAELRQVVLEYNEGIAQKPIYKEMTIEEIEAALGYKVKIIGGTEQ